jgi:hypothetical protein
MPGRQQQHSSKQASRRHAPRASKQQQHGTCDPTLVRHCLLVSLRTTTHLHCIWSLVISSSSIENSVLSGAGAALGAAAVAAAALATGGRGAVTVAVTVCMPMGSASAVAPLLGAAPLPLLPMGGAYDRPAAE